MKKLIALFFSVAVLFFIPGRLSAQVKPAIKIASVKQRDKTVDFMLSSPTKFIFGGNRYILNIGEKKFLLNTQSSRAGKSMLTFFIPVEDFNKIANGSGIYLTYGVILGNEGEQEREEISKQSPKCWSLGKFSKNLLTK